MEEKIGVTWPDAGQVMVSDSCRTDITYLGVCVPDAKAIVVELSPEQLYDLLVALDERYDQVMQDRREAWDSSRLRLV